MRLYRVYYRNSLSDYSIYQNKSTIVRAFDKRDAIMSAKNKMARRGIPFIPTGYVTLVGKKQAF